MLESEMSTVGGAQDRELIRIMLEAIKATHLNGNVGKNVKYCSSTSMCCGPALLMSSVKEMTAHNPLSKKTGRVSVSRNNEGPLDYGDNKKQRQEALDRRKTILKARVDQKYRHAVLKAVCNVVRSLENSSDLSDPKHALVFLANFAPEVSTGSSGHCHRYRVRNFNHNNNTVAPFLCHTCIRHLVSLSPGVSANTFDKFYRLSFLGFKGKARNNNPLAIFLHRCKGSRGSFTVNETWVHGWVPYILSNPTKFLNDGSIPTTSEVTEKIKEVFPRYNARTVGNNAGGVIRRVLYRGCVKIAHESLCPNNVVIPCKGWAGCPVIGDWVLEDEIADPTLLTHNFNIMVRRISEGLEQHLREAVELCTDVDGGGKIGSCFHGLSLLGPKTVDNCSNIVYYGSNSVTTNGLASMFGVSRESFDKAVPRLSQDLEELENWFLSRLSEPRCQFKTFTACCLMKNLLCFEDRSFQAPHTVMRPEEIKLLRESRHHAAVVYFPLSPAGMWIHLQPEAAVKLIDGKWFIDVEALPERSGREKIQYLGKFKNPNNRLAGNNTAARKLHQAASTKFEGVMLFVPAGQVIFLPLTLLHGSGMRTDVLGNPSARIVMFFENQRGQEQSDCYRPLVQCFARCRADSIPTVANSYMTGVETSQASDADSTCKRSIISNSGKENCKWYTEDKRLFMDGFGV